MSPINGRVFDSLICLIDLLLDRTEYPFEVDTIITPPCGGNIIEFPSLNSILLSNFVVVPGSAEEE